MTSYRDSEDCEARGPFYNSRRLWIPAFVGMTEDCRLGSKIRMENARRIRGAV